MKSRVEAWPVLLLAAVLVVEASASPSILPASPSPPGERLPPPAAGALAACIADPACYDRELLGPWAERTRLEAAAGRLVPAAAPQAGAGLARWCSPYYCAPPAALTCLPEARAGCPQRCTGECARCTCPIRPEVELGPSWPPPWERLRERLGLPAAPAVSRPVGPANERVGGVAIPCLTRRLGRPPTPEEIADALYTVPDGTGLWLECAQAVPPTPPAGTATLDLPPAARVGEPWTASAHLEDGTGPPPICDWQAVAGCTGAGATLYDCERRFTCDTAGPAEVRLTLWAGEPRPLAGVVPVEGEPPPPEPPEPAPNVIELPCPAGTAVEVVVTRTDTVARVEVTCRP